MQNISFVLRRHIWVLLILLWGPNQLLAQVPVWQGAIHPATGESSLAAIATDNDGNVYLTGRVIGIVSFGSINVGSTGATTLYIAKWSSTAQLFEWVRTSSSTGAAYGNALAVSNGMVYVAGNYEGTVTFGPTTLVASGLVSDGFVLGLTTEGIFTWAKAISSPSVDGAVALAVSGSSIYVAGDVGASATLGGLTLQGQGWGNSATYVAKLTEAGSATNFVWAVPGGTGGGNFTYALAASGAAVYLGGNYISATTAFGTTTLTNTKVNTRDGFIAKLLDAGSSASYQWAQGIGGPGEEFVWALAANGSALYVGGQFGASATLGGLTLQSTTAVKGFVAKLIDSGLASSFIWAQPVSATVNSTTKALAVSGAQVYATGLYVGTATIGPTILPSGGGNTYVARLLDAGPSSTYTWGAGSTTTTNICQGAALALNGSTVYVGGYGYGTIGFGATILPPVSPYDAGFLAVLGNAVALTATPEAASLTLRLYPNPASGSATLSGAIRGATVLILDALGRSVAKTTANASGTAMLPAGLPAGIYLVRAGAGTVRWVVE